MEIPSTSRVSSRNPSPQPTFDNGMPFRPKLHLKTAPPKLLMSQPIRREGCRCIGRLLLEIAQLWKKKTSSCGEEPLINYQPTRFSQLFVEHILDSFHCTQPDCKVNQDDMLWYVPVAKAPTSNMAVGQQILQVFRRSNKNKPTPGDRLVNWEETVCLNVILQQFDYFVTCAVCIKSQPHNLQIIRKNCQRVYPSPSKRRMDVKGECEEMTYPKLYFAIDDFETVFSDIVVTESECVCVELVCRDRFRNKEAVIFLGSIRFDVLKKLYDSRGNSTWTWAQKLVTSGQRRHEFVKMRGPNGKGFAEMAVTRLASLGFETPMSEHGFELNTSESSWTAEQRRMSDTNIFGKLMYKRSALTPGPTTSGIHFNTGPRSRRWTSDADSVNNDSDFDARSVVSETSGPMSASQISNVGSSWSIKNIGSALTWLKEKKETPALNAYLTYVTLPWKSIMEDMLLVSPRKPIFTFDLDYLEKS